ncbi:uncharacterized protein RAG0_08354 [Rhynchosporium agropyri]|uniref:Uncharacterized protein n=1 Tax=Rhynchosporium agropyri TaxID=914238 RepID=A0A1E1KQI8_9HELO|nr:uncharacterized protein RAG0_08354 [Rhynchosporium agropyri]
MWYNHHFKPFRLFNSFNILDSILTFYPCVNLSENPFASSFSLTAPSFHTYCPTTLRHKETGRSKAASLEIHKSLNSASEKHHAVASSNFQPLTALFDTQLSLAQQHILHPHLSFPEESFHTGKGKSNTSSTPTSTLRSLTHDPDYNSIHPSMHTSANSAEAKTHQTLTKSQNQEHRDQHFSTPYNRISTERNFTNWKSYLTYPESNPSHPRKHPTTSSQTTTNSSLTNSQPGRPSHTDINTREYSNNLYHCTQTRIHTKATKNHHRTILPTVSPSIHPTYPSNPRRAKNPSATKFLSTHSTYSTSSTCKPANLQTIHLLPKSIPRARARARARDEDQLSCME